MLTVEQKDRYARQILFPEIGEAGQEALGRRRVLISGLGGLGSLVSFYLTAGGIGTLRLADRDTVSLSDLNRQILYTEADIGRPKTEAATERLSALNRSCRIEPVFTDLCSCTDDLLKDCDVVVDATDNLPARRAINGAAVKQRVPMVHGGIDGFSGTVTVVLPGKGACLECLFPDRGIPAAPRAIPAIGAVVGTVASLQCAEVIKLLLNIGRPMSDRLLKIRVDRGEWRFIRTRRNPHCALCAKIE